MTIEAVSHIAVGVRDMEVALRFYRDVLGLRVTADKIEEFSQGVGQPPAKRRAVYLRWVDGPHASFIVLDQQITNDIKGQPAELFQMGVHHFAFWVDDWNAVREAADLLAFNGVTIDVAPTRHGVTRGHTTYFFDPVGNRNEVFTGGYWVDPDFEPITWTEEEMGRAMFYYAREVNERFFTVHS